VGSFRIKTEEACKAAASALEIPFNYKGNWSSYPRGCEADAGGVYFNVDLVGASAVSDRLLCIADAASCCFSGNGTLCPAHLHRAL
jgi:hypothetical protein